MGTANLDGSGCRMDGQMGPSAHRCADKRGVFARIRRCGMPVATIWGKVKVERNGGPHVQKPIAMKSKPR